MATIMVVDGNSLVHRAFHAIPPLSTTTGLPTNAVYGFTNMLLKALAEYKPDIVLVAFDKGRVTFRHRIYAAYKAGRPETAADLRPQFPLVKKVLQALGIPFLERDEYEADDIIGALVDCAEREKQRSLILTGDQDLLQLVSPLTSVLITRRGISQLEVFDERGVAAKFGLGPEYLVDIKALVGDPSDSIPGVPGIGVKTAVKLLRTYRTVETLLASTHELPLRIQEALETHRDQVLIAKQLVTINRRVPETGPELLGSRPRPDRGLLVDVFRKLEFRNLLQPALSFLPEEKTVAPARQALAKPITPRTDADLAALLSAAREAEIVGLAVDGSRATGLARAAVTAGDDTYLLDPAADARTRAVIRELVTDPDLAMAVHDAKDAIWICRAYGSLRGLAFDTMVAAYLANPTAPGRELKNVALDRLGVVLPEPEDETNALAARAQTTAQLVPPLRRALAEQEQDALFNEVELPLVKVLAAMEMAGIKVDREQLAEMSDEFGRQIDTLAEHIYRLAGETFNINSPKQLGHILFEKMGLPKGKKTKTGYSTSASVLLNLADSHEIAARILEFRQLVKLKGTYTDGLGGLVNPKTGRLHTTLHQTVTATGRLSSAEPNLQNIPVRLELGRRIRKVFTPSSGAHLLLAADYSQIELRVLAHLSGDPALISAFRANEDIHRRTASEVFGLSPEAVTPAMRSRAKAVNFGIVYGISDFGLARDLGIPRREAREYIQRYFERLPDVKLYIDRTIQEARERGYVTTILNRRRPMPELFSANRAVRNFGERAAVNTPIQGSAADIIKMAMVAIHQRLREREMKTRLILQVHDELIFDAPRDELETMIELVRAEMEGVLQLAVPLIVDLKAGPNWCDVKEIPREVD